MTSSQARPLTREEVAAFGAELDELRSRIVADLGENDARYVRRIRDAVRWSELGGRALLFAGILLALGFQWGVALHDLELERVLRGEKSVEQLRRELKPVLRKARRQLLKDYAIFPLLAGPFFVPVMAGNLGANLIRNVWAFIIIFCGHFTERVE